MTLGAPGYLWGASVAAVVVVALHLLAWRRPTPLPLPTARFVPATPSRAVARRLQLTDAALLALRVLALLLAGAAMAEPTIAPQRRGTARVIAADRSRAVGDVAAVARHVDSLARGAGVARVVWFDSVADRARPVATDLDSAVARTEARGSIAAALVAATREATRLARVADSVEIVLVSPVTVEEWDEAVAPVRESWGGSLGIVRVAARRVGGAALPDAAPPGAVASLDDPVWAATTAAALPPTVRAARGAPGAADSAFARAGGIVLVWPARSARDSLMLTVTTGRHASVGSFERGDVASTALAGIAVAWDAAGGIMAAEQGVGAGCIRELGFLPSTTGDRSLRPSLLDVMTDLAQPCGGRDWTLVPQPRVDALVADIAGRRDRDATRRGGVDEVTDETSATRWLLLAALAALALEWWLRGRRVPRGNAEVASVAGDGDREAA